MKIFVITIIASLAITVAPASIDRDAKIVRQESEVEPDGSYKYEFESDNGIYQSEQGVGGQYAQGAASWIAQDGTPIQLSYIADENGYRATGDHLPTPPPIPAYILRALEYIRVHSTTVEPIIEDIQPEGRSFSRASPPSREIALPFSG